MPNRPVLTGNLPPTMHAFDSNASTHNIKTERVLVPYQHCAQHVGQCGVEVEGGQVLTHDWFLNL
jgi:hypothetical protein